MSVTNIRAAKERGINDFRDLTDLELAAALDLQAAKLDLDGKEGPAVDVREAARRLRLRAGVKP
jgi:hypothetical protein